MSPHKLVITSKHKISSCWYLKKGNDVMNVCKRRPPFGCDQKHNQEAFSPSRIGCTLHKHCLPLLTFITHITDSNKFSSLPIKLNFAATLSRSPRALLLPFMFDSRVFLWNPVSDTKQTALRLLTLSQPSWATYRLRPATCGPPSTTPTTTVSMTTTSFFFSIIMT